MQTNLQTVANSWALEKELDGAHADLARLANLLTHAFEELLASFNEIQATTAGNANTAIHPHVLRAVTALQCEDMASQLIGHTCKRLDSARGALKHMVPLPQQAQSSAPGDDEGVQCTIAPVHQEAVDAGTVELF